MRVEHHTRLSLRHLRFGWWALLVFALLGLGLEALHGFKVGYYLDVSKETRRLMWRLGHAHGVLIALLNIAFGVTLRVALVAPRAATWASRGLLAAGLTMPSGFVLAGFGATGGDPGLAIALVPLGAISLITGVGAAAWGLGRGA